MEQHRPDIILNMLYEAGYEAYFVGGCVRDMLLGRPVHDWDITTSALPEQTQGCFEKTVPTGIRHGTVTVLQNGFSAEVTTYRSDGEYRDGRHPEGVTFVRSLSEDLSRRDFTVNAMAMDRQGRVVDIHDGRKDLADRVIRCVGDPCKRFREDALRMLRAIRFSAQLDFTVEEQTLDAIGLLSDRCNALSAERVRDEMEKTLLSDRPQALSRMADLGLLKAFVSHTAGDLAWIASLEKEPLVRWTALCRAWKGLDLKRLRLDKRTAVSAMTAAGLTAPKDRLGWKYLISEQGALIAELLAAISGDRETVRQILQSGECLFLRDLAVSGSDFKDLSGPDLGQHLKFLLRHVLEHPEHNQKENLINFSKNSIDYRY